MNVNYVTINSILRKNQVLKVARELSANAIEKPNDDHICQNSEVKDDDDEHELSSRLGKK